MWSWNNNQSIGIIRNNNVHIFGQIELFRLIDFAWCT